MPEFHTYRLGGDNFLTAAGEVVYTYKCPPVLVRAVETPHCYDALPVQVGDPVRNRVSIQPFIDQPKPVTVNEPTWFIEPLTHMLTKTATRRPCVKEFFGRYQDLFGRWIAITPRIVPTRTPKELDLSIIYKPYNFSIYRDDDPDFSSAEAGIYNFEDVDSLQDFLAFGRAQKSLTYKLTEQAKGFQHSRYIGPNQLFPDVTVPGGSWHTFILGKIWGFFRSLGEAVSVFLAIVFIIRLIWFSIKVCTNCRFIYSVHGFSRTLMWSLCSDVLFSWNYRRAWRNIVGTNNQQRQRTDDGNIYQDDLELDLRERQKMLAEDSSYCSVKPRRPTHRRSLSIASAPFYETTPKVSDPHTPISLRRVRFPDPSAPITHEPKPTTPALPAPTSSGQPQPQVYPTLTEDGPTAVPPAMPPIPDIGGSYLFQQQQHQSNAPL